MITTTKDLKKNMAFWMLSVGKIYKYFAKQQIGKGNERRFFFDNGGKVLFVAHLDTVLPPRIKQVTSKRMYATGLDDRLGCMLAYNLGEKLGADVLLCDFEERCRSSARFHDCKEYNWVTEFDRMGKDIVVYENSSIEFLQALQESWEIGFGSYSDISDLQTTACSFNLGIGYHRPHVQDSYVELKELKKQMQRFQEFYKEYHGQRFEADVEQEQSLLWNDYGCEDIDQKCDVCSEVKYCETIHGYEIYDECFEYMLDVVVRESCCQI